MEHLNHYFLALYTLSAEMAPYLLLGFFFAGLLHEYIRSERIVKYLGGNRMKSALYAALLGVPLPLCSCGVIPTGIAFHREGASTAATISFLISTPQTGVDSILVTWSLLGWPMAVIRPIAALITGLIGGGIALITGSKEEIQAAPVQNLAPVSGLPAWVRMLKYAFVEFMEDIAKWLLIGLLLAALMAVLIPDGFFMQFTNLPWLGMLMVLLVSVPLYVCATGSVPIAAVLMMKGLSPGAALVFLMAGPATNIATITLIAKTLGRKVLAIYLVSIIGGALLFGFLIDIILPAQYLFGLMDQTAHHAGHSFLPNWVNIGSLIILGIFMAYAILKRYIPMNLIRRTPDVSGKGVEHRVKVTGMTCNHCKAAVEKALLQIPGIEDVTADTQTGLVTFTCEQLDLEVIRKKVEALGYGFSGEVSSAKQS